MAEDKLARYRARRDMSRTPEPAGSGAPEPAGARLRFVVQKHGARRLHYDLRLELDGVLKSWAVTKGPSLRPGERRLAVHVEDHPLEYADFEGVIPQGQYGAGAVMVWDRGWWEPVSPDPREAYEAGRLKLRLHGAKLRGGWALVRMGRSRSASGARAKAEDGWLLIKERDAAARGEEELDILEERPESVITGRTLEEIARHGAGEVWESDRPAAPAPSPPPATAAPRAAPSPAAPAAPPRPDPARLRGARQAPLPEFVEPELAAPVARVPEGERWLHEIKFDGYRALCRIEEGTARFFTRRGLDWTDRFAALAHAMGALPVHQALLDGEVVVLQPGGTTSFSALQDALSEGRSEALSYFVFDLLHLDGWDLRAAPLEERKAALAALLASLGPAAPPSLLLSEHIVGQGRLFLHSACELGLEGIVSKRRDAPYRSGRSGSWLKARCTRRQELVICGFTRSSTGMRGIGSLVVGHRDERGVLVYAGRVGTGFTEQVARDLRARLEPRRVERPPFPSLPPDPGVRKGVVWVEPELVCEVEFHSWTADGLLRIPSYKGLREDKQAAEVVRELGEPAPGAPTGLAGSLVAAPAAAPEVKLTHPDRVLYPGQGLTKQGLADYYTAVAPLILPHLHDRPLSLLRCPSGDRRECFFHKHFGPEAPPSLRRVPVPEKPGGELRTYVMVEDLAGLIALVQLGVLEIHPWGSRRGELERPDRLIFDLDPGPGVAWEQVVEAALALRDRLAGLGLASFVKTTGGKGLHVTAPIAPGPSWAELKEFARALAVALAREAPRRYTATVALSARSGKIYIDYLRNERGATAVAPYSTRARPGAPVAAPLRWEELGPSLRSDHFTVENMLRRLTVLTEDPWSGMLDLQQTLSERARRAVGG